MFDFAFSSLIRDTCIQFCLGKEKNKYLDSAPETITAKAHRLAYSTDGDYFSKPNAEDIFERVYEIMHEANPEDYHSILQ